jgi:murein DD-endopeptidase MepM/ murein hydrolase activator NlpD
MGSVAVEAGKITADTLYPPNIARRTFGIRFSRPVSGRITTRFGEVSDGVKSKGIDIETQMNVPVRASKEGRVSFVSESVKGYGKMIIIDHAGGYQTVYAFNSRNLVTKGQKVKQKEVIAHAGTSARTQRPGLHFEIRKDHEPLNPEAFLI